MKGNDFYGGNNLKLARHILSLNNREETLLALAAFVKQHRNESGDMNQKLNVSIGELETFLYQPKRD